MSTSMPIIYFVRIKRARSTLLKLYDIYIIQFWDLTPHVNLSLYYNFKNTFIILKNNLKRLNPLCIIQDQNCEPKR